MLMLNRYYLRLVRKNGNVNPMDANSYLQWYITAESSPDARVRALHMFGEDFHITEVAYAGPAQEST